MKEILTLNNLTKKYEIPAEISSLMIDIFQRGKEKLGDRALSTSIVKLLEQECNDNLRANGFPSFLEDKNQKQEAEEIII